MLGFSDEDKQRIGIAQQGAGKGVVRGVLGLPGRLVGGILGGGNSQAEAHPNMASENQVHSLVPSINSFCFFYIVLLQLPKMLSEKVVGCDSKLS